MISVAEADALLASQEFPGGEETVALEAAVGRVLTQPLVADRDGPPYDRVAMDGYAVYADDATRSWTVHGLQFAGRPALERPGQATAVEVATGAVLPRGCDAVIPYEQTVRHGDSVALPEGQPLPKPGAHVHRQGTDYRQGDTLLPAGTRLRSPHLHALASVGTDKVPVVRRPVWALAATGDELVEVRDEPEAWQIRRSNAAAIGGEAAAWGLSPRAQVVLRDDRARLVAGLKSLLPGLDVLILTGGVSAGALDLVPEVLVELGAQPLFHKISQRPGKPLWCGRFPAAGGRPGTLVFGLPGNPVSSLFAFRRYALPWLLAAEGRPLTPARVAVPGLTAPPPGVTLFLPWSDTSGVLDWKGSGDFLALAGSTGFIEVDASSLPEPKYHPWGGVL
jgi:molybdopterin molybdotransferase